MKEYAIFVPKWELEIDYYTALNYYWLPTLTIFKDLEFYTDALCDKSLAGTLYGRQAILSFIRVLEYNLEVFFLQ